MSELLNSGTVSSGIPLYTKKTYKVNIPSDWGDYYFIKAMEVGVKNDVDMWVLRYCIRQAMRFKINSIIGRHCK